ncbi:MAG: ABC transporter permease [Dehalococcoidales bacterium]|nr:ABC transporter permease [Dehalococcoidales bacterium]
MNRRLVTRDSVAVTGAAIGLTSFFFGWLTFKPNRLAAGTGLSLWEGSGWTGTSLLLILWLACLALSLRGREKRYAAALGITANLIVAATLLLAGLSADKLMEGEATFARVSLGTGVWVALGGAYVTIFAARQRLEGWPVRQNLVSWSGLVVPGLLLIGGWLDNLSILQEFFGREERFIQETWQHIFIFSGSVSAGAVLGIPLGVWAARSKHIERPVFFITNITQTIPSLALFGLLIAPLSALSFSFPVLRELGIRGVGTTPAVIALIIYSLLPIVRNTFASLKQIDPAVIDAGQGMGMSRFQIFRRLEVPLSAPLVLEGIRTASVQAVGNTAVAALIGAGGLGWFIFQGLGQAAPDLIILGAIPIIVLALLVDAVMRGMVRLAKPEGLSGGSG